MMKSSRRTHKAIMSALLVSGLLAASVTAPVRPEGTAQAVPLQQAEEVTGQGFLAKAACIACLAGFGFAGGGTVIGVMLVASAFPEAAAGCALGCVAAFS